MLFHNFSERVEYNDPGPCGGVMGTYMSSCPNHPKAAIVLREIEEKKTHKKKKVKCQLCGETFSGKSNVEFHKKRKHVMNRT